MCPVAILVPDVYSFVGFVYAQLICRITGVSDNTCCDACTPIVSNANTTIMKRFTINDCCEIIRCYY